MVIIHNHLLKLCGLPGTFGTHTTPNSVQCARIMLMFCVRCSDQLLTERIKAFVKHRPLIHIC